MRRVVSSNEKRKMDARVKKSSAAAMLHTTAGAQGFVALASGSLSNHKASRRVGGTVWVLT